MSNASQLAALEYEAETTFGENVSTFGTHRVPIFGDPDITGLKHDKQDAKRVSQRLQEGSLWILGPQSGSFKTKMYLHGHGSTTSGATTVDPVETFLSFAFGTPSASIISAASGTTLTGGTATVPLTTASGTFAAGSLCRIGSLNDARGNGQFYAIATHTTTTLTLLQAMDGVPSNGDVLFSAANFFLPEDPTGAPAAITGLRMRFLTANLRYELHGCYPTNLAITGLNPGEIPTIEVTWGVSWWQYSTATYPSVLASNQYNPGPVASGSFFLNDVGTLTRVKRTVREFSIDVKMGVDMLPGPGGVNAYQVCIGAKRVVSDITVKWTEDSDAATLTPALDTFALGTTKKHMTATLSTTAGSAIGFRFNALAVKSRPIQTKRGNINSVSIECDAQTGSTLTSDLTASAMIMGFA